MKTKNPVTNHGVSVRALGEQVEVRQVGEDAVAFSPRRLREPAEPDEGFDSGSDRRLGEPSRSP